MREVIFDEKLSWKAKGLYIFLYENNQEEISLEKICDFSRDGRESTRSARNELIKMGYLKTKTIRENGLITGSKWILKR